jgi:hypothetical protein
MSKQRILFFAPFALVWHQALIEGKLAGILQKEYEIISLTCSGTFSSSCTAIKAVGGEFSSTPKAACSRCIRNTEIINTNLLKKTTEAKLEDFLTTSEVSLIKNTIQRSTINQKISYIEDGFAIGKIALYETLNNYKKVDLNLTQEEEKFYEGCLFNSIALYKASKKAIEIFQPDIVIAHAPFYSGTSMLAQYSIKLGITTYFMDGSNNISERRSSIRIWDLAKYGFFPPGYRIWDSHSENFKVQPKEMKRVARHINETKSSRSFSVYSPRPKGLSTREFFSIGKSDKIILACLSSHDEYFADLTAGFISEQDYISRVYPDQINWIEALIEWVAKEQNTHLIVRLHPREFPNKRESQVSPRGVLWEQILRNLPKNVHIDHPKLNFALHDHFKEIDVLTTGWSTTGLEALSEGIPVVTYDKNLVKYPVSIHFSGESEKEYFENLILSLKLDKSFEVRQKAIFYQIFHTIRGSIYLRGQIKYIPSVENKTLIRKTLSLLEKIAPEFSKKIDTKIPTPRKERGRLITMMRDKKSSPIG